MTRKPFNKAGRLNRPVRTRDLVNGELVTVDCDNCGQPTEAIDFSDLTHFETRALCDSCRTIREKLRKPGRKRR